MDTVSRDEYRRNSFTVLSVCAFLAVQCYSLLFVFYMWWLFVPLQLMDELEDVKSETELLKKQLSSERLTIKNLETLLATNREREFQSHLTTHEKDSEIQLLKDKFTLSESKL